MEFNHPVLKEILEEYVALFYIFCEKFEFYDAKIAEISQTPRFEEPAKKACCLLGIATHTAMATISEISDFTRFPFAENFAVGFLHFHNTTTTTLRGNDDSICFNRFIDCIGIVKGI